MSDRKPKIDLKDFLTLEIEDNVGNLNVLLKMFDAGYEVSFYEPKRHYSVWRGGSLISNFETFDELDKAVRNYLAALQESRDINN